MISSLQAFFFRHRQCLLQQKEIKQLKLDVEKLRIQNESMRSGMRRCTTCDYRIAFKEQQQPVDKG